MPDKTVNELPDAGTITGTDAVVLGRDNEAYKTTLASIITLFLSTSRTLLGNLIFNNVAYGIQFKSGADGRIGQTTLITGSRTVNNTSITANSIILLTRATLGGTPGHLSYTISAGVSFSITSSSGADTSVINYVIFEQV